MKKVLSIVLIFAVVLAALLGVSALAERMRPAAEEAAETETPKEQKTIANTMDITDATVIRLSDSGTAVSGLGASVQEGRVVIAYPGTYWIEGSLTDGQILVDLGDFDGAAYLVLNGVSVACGDGPALYVRQADLAALYLMEGTENSFRDGADYMVQETQEKKTGAGIYSADDLLFYGDGALTVTGTSADGVRSKDGLILAGGTITVYAADDGLQASDGVDIYGGTVTIGAYGDGIGTTEGAVTIYDGDVTIASRGDGIDAVTDVVIYDGSLSVTACGGAENYADVALSDSSAKGVKGQNIQIAGGVFDLNTADDAIHGRLDVTITGGTFSLAAGDDGISAAGVLDARDARIDIAGSYEGLEGGTVRLSGVTLSAVAQNNGVDTGAGGFMAYGASMDLTAPRAISSEGALSMLGCDIRLEADGTDSLFSFAEANVIGGTILAWADGGTAEELLAKGAVPGSLLFVFGDPLAAGTEITLRDPNGNAVMTLTRETDTGAVLIASGGLMEGQTYTLTAGEDISFDVEIDAADCVIRATEPSVPVQTGGWGGMPMPGGRR